MSEFVIVGGGVVGCAVAWELARLGVEVTLLERDRAGAGASGGPGRRGVRANGRDLRELPLMRLAYDLWPRLDRELAAETGYLRTGGLRLIEKESSGGAEARCWAQREAGIPTEVLGRDELLDRQPGVSADVRAAVYCPLDGVADQAATTASLAAAARRCGAGIREHTTVSGIEIGGGRAVAVRTAGGGRVPVGRTLLVLANSYAASILGGALRARLPVWRVVPQVAFVSPIRPLRLPHLLGHQHRPLSVKQLPGGEVMISGGWRGRWDEAAQRGEPDPAATHGLLTEAATVLPGLREARLTTVAADRPESASADGIPIVDLVPGLDNAFVATGWSGHGFGIAPAVARLLADWAVTGTRPPLLAPFTYQRFRTAPTRQRGPRA